jgi:hypothetical protein
MKYTIGRIQCSIELNKKQWNKLNKIDYLEVVSPALEKAGALRDTIYYNEHFGRALFFTADSEIDAQNVTNALDVLLQTPLKLLKVDN